MDEEVREQIEESAEMTVRCGFAYALRIWDVRLVKVSNDRNILSVFLRQFVSNWKKHNLTIGNVYLNCRWLRICCIACVGTWAKGKCTVFFNLWNYQSPLVIKYYWLQILNSKLNVVSGELTSVLRTSLKLELNPIILHSPWRTIFFNKWRTHFLYRH